MPTANGNVLTDPAATFAALTVLGAKTDAVARTDAECATYAGAEWPTEVDNALKDLNSWLVGSSNGGIAGNTTTLLGRLNAAQQLRVGTPTLNLGFGGLVVVEPNAWVLFSSNETDATAKTGILGTDHYTNAEQPLTALRWQSGSGYGNVQIGGGTSTGNAATSIQFWTAANSTTVTGTQRGSVTSAGLFDWAGDLTLNSASPTLTVGAGTGSPTVTVSDKDTTTQSGFIHDEAGNTIWELRKGVTTRDWLLRRHNAAGAFQANSIRVGFTGGAVDLESDLTLNSASPSLTVGDGTGTVTVDLQKSAGGTIPFAFKAGASNYKRFLYGTDETLKIQHYSGTWDDALTVDNSANVEVANNLTLNSASPSLTMGTGAGSPGVTYDKDGTGATNLTFAFDGAVGANSKNILHDTDETLKIRHHDGAAWDDVITIGNTNGGSIGFYGTTPTAQSAAYTRNATIVESRTLLASASATTLNNNNVLAALIADLQAIGILG